MFPPWLLLLLAPLLLAWSGEGFAQTTAAMRPGEVIVRYHDTVDVAGRTAMKTRFGLAVTAELLDGRAELLQLPVITDVERALAVLGADPRVLYAEPNYLRRPVAAIPNDPLFPLQWGLRNTGQPNFFAGGPRGIAGADLNLVEAWDANGDGVPDRTGDGSVIVAIVDEGVVTGHEDLAANIVDGFDFEGNDPDPNPPEQELHGTMVAGCIGAIGNNGIGIASPAWNVKLMPLRFGFDVASEVKALQFARDRGARIINASYGGPGISKAEYEAIADLGRRDILFVAAAGNSDSDIDRSVLSYPANHDLPNIVTVAASNRQDQIAGFSQHGAVSVDVAAPGLQIITTFPPDTYTAIPGTAGTSFATPYVSGIAALIRMYHPTASALEVRGRLIEGAHPGRDPGNPARGRVAAGRVDADRSLDLETRPAVVIRRVRLLDPDAALDPGEELPIEVTLENLWATASNVSVALRGPPEIAVLSGATSYGHIATGASVTRSFNLRVASGIEDYRNLAFTLDIEADGYRTQRSFRQELAILRNGNTAQDVLQADAYDEFHTWHFDLPAVPADARELVFEASAETDIDILVKLGRPARYLIDLGAPPDADDSYYTTDADWVSATESSSERITIPDPAAGTYFVTVVNYSRKAQNRYSLQALAGTPVAEEPPPEEDDGGAGGDNGGAGGSGGGGGGRLTGWTLLTLALLLAVRHRRGFSCSPARPSRGPAKRG